MALSSDQKQEITNINIGLLGKLSLYLSLKSTPQSDDIPYLTQKQIAKIAQEITDRFNTFLGSRGISDDVISKARKDLNDNLNAIVSHYMDIPILNELEESKTGNSIYNSDGSTDIDNLPTIMKNVKTGIAQITLESFYSDLIAGFKNFLDVKEIDVKKATDTNFKEYLESLQTEGHTGSQVSIPTLKNIISDIGDRGEIKYENLKEINKNNLDDIKALLSKTKKYSADQLPSEYPLIDKLRSSGLISTDGKIKIDKLKKYLASFLNTDSAGSDVLSILKKIEDTFPKSQDFKTFEDNKTAADLNNANGSEDYAVSPDISEDKIIEKIALAFDISELSENATEEDKAERDKRVAEASSLIEQVKNIMSNPKFDPKATDKKEITVLTHIENGELPAKYATIETWDSPKLKIMDYLAKKEARKQNAITLGPEMMSFPSKKDEDWADFGGKLWEDWAKKTFGGNPEEIGNYFGNLGKDIIEILGQIKENDPIVHLKSVLKLENEKDGVSLKNEKIIRTPEAKISDYSSSNKESRLTYGEKNSSLYDTWVANFYIKSQELNPNWKSVNKDSLEAKSPYEILLNTLESHNYAPDGGKAKQIVSIYKSSLTSSLLKNMDKYLESTLNHISSREIVKAIRNILGDKSFKGSPVETPNLGNESAAALLSLDLLSWYDIVSTISETDDEKDFGSIKTEIISMLPTDKTGNKPVFESYPEAIKSARNRIKERDGIALFLEKLNEYKFDLNHPFNGMDEKPYSINSQGVDGTDITVELNSFFKDITKDINSYIKSSKIQSVKNNLRSGLRKLKDPENPEEEKTGDNSKLLPIKAEQIALKKELFFKIAVEDEETNPLLNVFGKDKDQINFYISTKVDRQREINISGKEKWGDDKLEKQKIVDAVNKVGLSGNLKPKTLSIEKMLLSGPDLYSNMFDVIIAWNPKYPLGDNDYLKDSPPAALNAREKLLLSQACLITRFDSINIPTPVKNTFSTPYQMRSIERLASNVNFNRKSHFTINADENLFVLDFTQNLAGHTGKLEPFDAADSMIGTLKATATQANVQLMNNNIGFLKEISKTFPWEGRKGQTRQQQGLNNQGQGLCIIVKEKFLSNYLYENGILKLNAKKEPYWIFENVRILGTSDPVKFSRDEVNKHSFTVEFIFRRCYRLVAS
jgi:hypothetical protein